MKNMAMPIVDDELLEAAYAEHAVYNAVGQSDTIQVWAVENDGSLVYFHDPNPPNEESDDDSSNPCLQAHEYVEHVGGTVLLLTIESRVIAAQVDADR